MPTIAFSEGVLYGIAFALTAWLVLAVRGWVDRRRRSRRAISAGQAERSARRLLVREGFDVVGEQVRRRLRWTENGQARHVELRADFLVEDGSGRYVAEVKQGRLVADLRHGPTRRQLLEYRLAFDVDGVLLVDADRRRVVTVGFPDLFR